MRTQRRNLSDNARHIASMALKCLLRDPYSLPNFLPDDGICPNIFFSTEVALVDTRELVSASQAYWGIYGAFWSTDPTLASNIRFPVDCQTVYHSTDNKWTGVHLQRRINFIHLLLSILQAGDSFGEQLLLSLRFLKDFGYIGPITYYHAGTTECVGYFIARNKDGSLGIRILSACNSYMKRAVIDDYGNLLIL